MGPKKSIHNNGLFTNVGCPKGGVLLYTVENGHFKPIQTIGSAFIRKNTVCATCLFIILSQITVD